MARTTARQPAGENKRWSYQASSGLMASVDQRMWFAYAAVQRDKTIESIEAMRREIVEYVTGKAPARPAELARIRARIVRGLPGRYETGHAVLEMLGDIAVYGWPDDYPRQRAARITAVTVDHLTQAAAAIQPEALTWVVIGDLSNVESPIRALGLGDVKVVGPTGKVLR